MIEQNQILTEQTEDRSTVRKRSYIAFIERYSLYSTLLVLKDYEDESQYEECVIIRDALKEYQAKYKHVLPKNFATHLSTYESKEYTDMMEKYDLAVGKKQALEKAKLIKIKLPIDDGL